MIQLCLKIRISDSIVFYQIHISLQQIFQRKFKVEIIGSVFKRIKITLVKDNGKINVTVFVEATSKGRPKDKVENKGKMGRILTRSSFAIFAPTVQNTLLVV